MFSFVDIQESFPNLNDIEGFNKLFKKSPSAFSEQRGSSVHNLWVLPGHIIVSLDEGHKLFAYDLLPKHSPWPNTSDFLMSNHVDKRKGGNYAVLEVFCEGVPTSLQMFIVLKNGEVHIWKFIRPGFEWRFVSKFNLSVSKNIQITSLCFDKKSKLLFWCERRTPTQCCVCNGKISADSGKSVLVNKSDLLHNCPPVQLFLVGPSGILLHPTANSPTGLTMYWSPVASRIQLQLWNYPHNGVIPVSASIDFQSIVTESLSLWINHNTLDPTIIAYCTHPISQELFMLESTCDLYTSQIDGRGKPCVSKLCTLCKATIGEINPRKTYTIFAFKRFLGLILEEQELLIFETYMGKLVWKSDTTKHDRVKAWVSQGDIPQVGLWCKSFMNQIRSESVMKQAETMLRLDVGKPPVERRTSKEYTLHLTFKGNHGKRGTETYVVVDNEESGHPKSSDNNHGNEKNSDAKSDHFVSDSVMLVADYLRDWGTKNLSCEVCQWLLSHPKLNGNVDWLQFQNEQQFQQFFQMFEDPCISLALLQKNRKYKLAVDRMVSEYVSKQLGKNLDCIAPKTQSLINQYDELSRDVQRILNVSLGDTSEKPQLEEFNFSGKFRAQLLNESLTKQDLCEILEWSAEMRPEDFVIEMKTIFELESKCEDASKDLEGKDEVPESVTVRTCLWKNVLRNDINSFEIICITLWKHSPQLLVTFVKMAQSVATISESSGFLQTSRRSSFVSLADVTQRAIDSLSYRSFTQKLDKDRVKVLVELMLLPETLTGITDACKLLLENNLYGEAIDLLENSLILSALHDRLFFMILTTLIEKSSLGRFSARLSKKIPQDFTADQLCNLMNAYEDHTNPTDVFTSGEGSTSLEDLKPLLAALLSGNSNSP